jgi:IS5 family transposase
VLCAAGYNIRWRLRAIVRLGLQGLLSPLFGLLVTLAETATTAMSISRTSPDRLAWSTR